jgi:Cys-tRNA(Pro) deacylase
MARDRIPKTRAIRALNALQIPFVPHPYKYIEKGGTTTAAGALQVDEHHIVKTLVMETDKGEPLLVLMHGDRRVSVKALARALGVKSVTPCTPEAAHKHTGYVVGGISPFGTRKSFAVYMESSIMGLEKIYINAGKKGLLAEMAPDDLGRALQPVPVEVALDSP